MNGIGGLPNPPNDGVAIPYRYSVCGWTSEPIERPPEDGRGAVCAGEEFLMGAEGMTDGGSELDGCGPPPSGPR